MFDYMKGLIFIPIFIFLLASFGKKIKNSMLFSENFIYGFVFYTCLQFMGGFVAQTLHLPWIFYKTYMLLLILLIAGISFNKGIGISKKAVSEHLRKYGLLYMIALILVCLSCLNLQYQWNANLVDDGYYLQKIRMAPFVSDYADFNFAAGYPASGSIVRNINTFEIEAAFFVDILHMDASIYAKVFLSFFNYTLILHTIYWFYHTLFSKMKTKRIILAVVPILFFGIYQELMVNYHILFMQDSWHFNTAIWYGSALVRCMGLFLFVTPFIKDRKLTLNKFILFVCSSIALLSKASQALPLIYLVVITYLITYTWQYVQIKRKGLLCILFILSLFCLLPVSDEIKVRGSVVMQQLGENSSTLVIKLSYFLLVISYLFEDTFIRKWNHWLTLIGCFIFVPRMNTLFLYLSVYDFVAARTVSLFFFALIICAFIYGYHLLTYVIKNKKELFLLYGGIAIALVSIPLISIQRNLGLRNSIQTVIENPSLQPGSTLALGKALDDLSKEEGKELDVLMPMWVVVNGTPHPVATMIRYNAFHIHSIGTIPRYGALFEDNPYYTYTDGVHVNFERWHSGEENDPKVLRSLLATYSEIDCIVVYFDDAKDTLENEFGYYVKDRIMLEDHAHYYYIMVKNTKGAKQ